MNRQWPKKQHTIPRVFLKNFCTPWGSVLCQFDKWVYKEKYREGFYRTSFTNRNIANIMTKNHFYTIIRQWLEKENDYILEDFWCNSFECNWNTLFQKIQDKSIGEGDWEEICKFVAHIVVRSEYIRNLSIPEDDSEFKKVFFGRWRKIFPSLNDQELKEMILKSLNTKEYLDDFIFDSFRLFLSITMYSQMHILYIQNHRSFILSDVPFVLDWVQKTLFIPISSKIGLYFKENLNRQGDEKFYDVHYRVCNSKKKINNWNKKIFQQAKRYIFFNNEVDKGYILSLEDK